MKRFEVTANEIKEAYKGTSGHIIRDRNQYARIYPYPHKDVKYNEQVILEVIAIDNNFSQSAMVRNPNGLEWITKLSRLRFCDEKGNKI